MRAQFINESRRKIFNPEYFKLPYQIPEDRFENGLLKSSTSKRGSIPRKLIVNSNTKYKNLQDYKARVNLSEVSKQINSDVSTIMKFMKNNKLTDNLLKPKLTKEADLKAYIENQIIIYTDEDEYADYWETGPLFLIRFPRYDMSLQVDYDIYKGCTVFTFGEDSSFYYYTVFTLDRNDVVGSGEEISYITVNDFINYVFYETIWRSTLKFLSYNSNEEELEQKVNVNMADVEFNTPYSVTKNYFNPNFKEMLHKFLQH